MTDTSNEAVARTLALNVQAAIDDGEAIARLTARAEAAEAELAQMRGAVEAEREACAQVAAQEGVYPELNIWAGGPEWYAHGKRIAAAIRARKEGE